jgi:hypothetical protein
MNLENFLFFHYSLEIHHCLQWIKEVFDRFWIMWIGRSRIWDSVWEQVEPRAGSDSKGVPGTAHTTVHIILILVHADSSASYHGDSDRHDSDLTINVDEKMAISFGPAKVLWKRDLYICCIPTFRLCQVLDRLINIADWQQTPQHKRGLVLQPKWTVYYCKCRCCRIVYRCMLHPWSFQYCDSCIFHSHPVQRERWTFSAGNRSTNLSTVRIVY